MYSHKIHADSPTDLYNQAVYWIWSMAEPNVTIVSASIPVLRGFVRNVRNRSSEPSYPNGAGYSRTGDSNGKFYNRSTVTAQRKDDDDIDVGSDSSILGRDSNINNAQRDGRAGAGGGITWTTEISVEYEPRPMTARRKARGQEAEVDEFEMGHMRHGTGASR